MEGPEFRARSSSGEEKSMKITIEGEHGEGKTLLAAIVATALHKAGYVVGSVSEVHKEKQLSISTDIMQQIRLAHLQEGFQICHPEVKKNVKIEVKND